MADSIRITTITAAVAALSITVTKADGTSGTLTIKDVTGLPEAVNPQDCPVLAPRPDNFITGFSITRDTFGADAAYKTANFGLNYDFFYCPVLEGAGVFEKFDEAMTAAQVIINHIATTSNALATDLLPSISRYGVITDLAGTLFHGCEIALLTSQFMETA